MQLEERSFGKTNDGSPVRLITARGSGGLEISVATYGATLVSVKFPDKNGNISELTLGFDAIEPYLQKHPFFGATVGRYANRIGNASFTLNGCEYKLAKNDGENHLHGGMIGFNRVMWGYAVTADGGEARIRFTYVSPDGDEGYPGELAVAVTYVVNDDNRLRFEYEATPSASTPVNLTNHTYWNLESPGTDVRNHLLQIHAGSYLSTDENLIPDGKLIPVRDTPYDFREQTSLRTNFKAAGGYDNNFVLDGDAGALREVAVVHTPSNGRRMVVYTDQAAIQLYTANKLTEMFGHDGVAYHQYGAMCLETGGYNNAVNIEAFPSSVIEHGATYRHVTEHVFSLV